MSSFPLLTVLIFLPAVAAFMMLFINENRNSNVIKVTALLATLIELFIALYMWVLFKPHVFDMQFTEKIQWLSGFNIYYSLGVDGISIFLVVLTAFLMPICILSSWRNVDKRLKEYMVCFLALESFLIGSFCATDIILFFVFFEGSLIPMFLIIGVWGSENRIYAAFKFFLYTFFGSVFLLVSFIFIYYHTETADIFELYDIVPTYPLEVQKWLWLGLFISFAIKTPMWPFHTWLPDAHVQAPTAGSVILAGVLLKLGGYGFMRFSLPMLPEASRYFADFVFVLSIVAVIYTSLVALMQENIKKMIAYSSVAHMGFVTAGIFSMNTYGLEGALIQMISHGLISGALFLCVGVLYDRMHTKEIAFYSGLTTLMPKFALVFMILMVSSVALPGTSGFIGEFLVLLGAFKVNPVYAALLASAMVLGAAYMLWLYSRVMFGEVKNNKLLSVRDLNAIELVSFTPIVLLVIFLGIYPTIITKDASASIVKIERIVK